MNFTGEIQDRLTSWLSTKPPLWQLCEGSLTVEEREESGAACAEFQLPPGVPCLKWDIGTGISFKMLGEQKTADGAFMLKLPDGSWEAHVVECKSRLTHNRWQEAREQMRWTIARLNALSGILGITLSRVITYTAYRTELISPSSSPFPTDFKQGVGPVGAKTEQQRPLARLREWESGLITVRGLEGELAHRRIQLEVGASEVTGRARVVLEAYPDPSV